MTRARRDQICLEETPYYHCINRCVRRSFLCGDDAVSGQNYDHRKQWLVDRFRELADVFAIDLCAYAVMSNHYHLVVKIDRNKALGWPAEMVADRWHSLFKGHQLVDRWQAGVAMGKAELKRTMEIIETWRNRLFDLGWFMRCLNENIARPANEEDKCTGRFWEGRYKSQALLDEAAVLSCMVYVDLNPIRASVCKTPEESDFTSIQARIRAFRQQQQPNQLVPFISGRKQKDDHLPLRVDHYLELVDWTGRAIRDDKNGHIPNELAHILDRINIQPQAWLNGVQQIERKFFRAIGPMERLRAFSQTLGQKWLQGSGASRRLFTCAPT